MTSKDQTDNGHPKQKIFWDVDDVILNTSETIINIINKKYREPNNLKPRNREYQKDWGYKSIWHQIENKDILDMVESEEFWNSVTPNPEFMNLVNSGLLDGYDNYLVTKGTLTNLSLKIGYLKSKGLNCDKDFKYDPILIIPNSENNTSTDKSCIDMSGGIQIDDHVNNLINTNAKIKILLKNNLETVYNNSFGHYTDKINADDTFYYVNSISEIGEILKFNLYIYKL